ncbi:helix-turn-helix domain-containing protein [Mycobacterium sp. M1]|uniref:Helix-turn-helix domain-containing protein n=1 Tax=Mycolicibacter acidiphilus TaxID=2835306 RepID=A0ABS5RKT3_9MYCO|nr:helix-turn-helix domain-containing protein [Mycolicibacter acidiphilus]
MEWERPSELVRELIRRGAQLTLDSSEWWLAGIQQGALASKYTQRIADDPVIVDTIGRSTRESCLRWLACNISRPGEPVSAELTTAELVAVRNLVSRGLDELAVMDSYRLAQNAALRYWMPVAFQVTSDPAHLREVLDVCQRSIASFIEAVVVQLCQMIRAERGQLARGTDPAVQEIVAQIIDGATPPANAEDRLGYLFGQHHTAAVVWSDRRDVETADLDRTTRAVMDTAAGRQAFMMRADAATRWVWLSGREEPELTGVTAALDRLAGIRIAVGPTSAGVDGFRRSHLDALTAQRMVAHTGIARRVVRFTEIELVALLAADPERAHRFITRALGRLASADADLRRTALTFIQERYSASRTAARLFIHRNTLQRRLVQVDELLPQPLEGAHVNVAVALEALNWMQRAASRAAGTGSAGA